MKKLLIGILALTSLSALAGSSYWTQHHTCAEGYIEGRTTNGDLREERTKCYKISEIGDSYLTNGSNACLEGFVGLSSFYDGVKKCKQVGLLGNSYLGYGHSKCVEGYVATESFNDATKCIKL